MTSLWQQAITPSGPLKHDLKVLIGPLIYPHEWGEVHDIAQALHCSESALKEQVCCFFAQSGGRTAWFNRSAHFRHFQQQGPHFELSIEHGLSLSWQEIWQQLPPGWEPDLVIWKHLFVFPPRDLDQCPCPLILLAGDWHLQFTSVVHYSQAFDLILGDRLLIDKLKQAGITDCAYWPSYGYAPQHFHTDAPPDTPPARSWDIAFAGSLRANIHTERNGYLFRLAQLSSRYRVRIETQCYDERYLQFWRETKIAFNFALRREMNLRAFEAAASGALLFQEESNLEIQDFLPPGECCVLYNADNFEEQIHYYLEHPQERQRIARQGAERIQRFCYARQSAALIQALPELQARCRLRRRTQARSWQQSPLYQQDLSRVQQGLFSSHAQLHLQARQYLQKRLQQVKHSGPGSADPLAQKVYCNASLMGLLQSRWTDRETPVLDGIIPRAQDKVQGLDRELAALQQASDFDPLVQNTLIWSALAQQDEHALGPRLRAQADFLATQQLSLETDAEHALAHGVLMDGQSRFHLLWQSALAEQNLKPCQDLLRWSLHFAWGHALRAHSPAQAGAQFKQSIEAQPELSEAYFSLALTLLQTRQAPLAVEALRLGLSQGVFYPAEWHLLLRLLLDLQAWGAVKRILPSLNSLFQSQHFAAFRAQIAPLHYEIQQKEQTGDGFLN